MYRLKEIRKAHKLSQKEVAERLNCSQQVYCNYELGQRNIPIGILFQLSDMFDVSIDYLLGKSDKNIR